MFHAGILKALAQQELLDKISFISSVSGGSILVGLVFAYNNYKWPTNQEYINNVFPKIEVFYTHFSLQREAIIQLLRKPYCFFRRNKVIRDIIYTRIGITGNLQTLPDYPRWSINANTFESGKSWRFSKKHMGLFVILSIISLIIVEVVNLSMVPKEGINTFLLYFPLPNFIIQCTLFLLFVRINRKEDGKTKGIVSNIADCMLGVYCIHDLVMSLIDMAFESFPSSLHILKVVAVVLISFVICIFVVALMRKSKILQKIAV